MDDDDKVASVEAHVPPAPDPFGDVMGNILDNVMALQRLLALSGVQPRYKTYGNLASELLKERRDRTDVISANMLGDPVWDMLLDLMAAEEQHKRVSVTSLCIASGMPPTTALRWIAIMVDQGILERSGDLQDKRRTLLSLTPKTRSALMDYLRKIANDRSVVLSDPFRGSRP